MSLGSYMSPIGGIAVDEGIGIGFDLAGGEGMGIPPPQHPLADEEPIGMADFPPIGMPGFVLDEADGIGIAVFPVVLADGIGIAVAAGPPPVAVVGIAIALSDAAGGGEITFRFGSTADGGRVSGPVGSVLAGIAMPPPPQLAAMTPTEPAIAMEMRVRFMGDIRFLC